MSRLEKGTRTITWTETRQICVGYHLCGICKIETPEPTTDQMLEFAQSNRGQYMWPDPREDGCTPTGWTNDYEHGLICPECTAVKNEALSTRRKRA